jgi:hypothetical protein
MKPPFLTIGGLFAILSAASIHASSDVYVRTADSIELVAPDGTITTTLQDPTDLASNKGIAVNGDGTIFFDGTNVLYSYQTGGTVINLGGIHLGSNEQWQGLAVTPNNTAYVLSQELDVFTEYIRVFNQSTSLVSSEDAIYNMTMDSAGNIYYTETGGIVKTTLQGVGSFYHSASSFDVVPQSIAADPSGDVFVSGSYGAVGQGIFEVAPNGAVTTVVSGSGVGGPLAEDLTGDLYWNNNGTLEMMPPGGAFTMVASGLPTNATIAAPLPEPAAAGLLIGGSMLFGGRRFRKRQRQ